MHLLAKVLLAYTPGFLKARACREMSADFTALAAEAAAAKGPDALEAFRQAARETGRRAAVRMRRDLGLREDFEDTLLAWRLVCKFSDMKVAVTDTADGALFEHLRCPLLAAGGAGLCDAFCLPLVEGLTEGLCPSCGVRVVRRAMGDRPCAKLLLSPGVKDA